MPTNIYSTKHSFALNINVADTHECMIINMYVAFRFEEMGKVKSVPIMTVSVKPDLGQFSKTSRHLYGRVSACDIHTTEGLFTREATRDNILTYICSL